MRIRQTLPDAAFELCNYLFLGILSLTCLYPIVHVIFASFSNPVNLLQHTGFLIKPAGFSLEGYSIVFKNPNILQGYLNTIIYVIGGSVLNVFLTAMGGYVLSRKSFLWKSEVMLFITFTMFFSGGLIPNYLLIKSIGLYDSRLSIILPGAISTYNLIITRTAMNSIPDSLEESAKLDGANAFVIFWKIILPVSKATLAVITLYYAVGHWNAWFNASIYLRRRALYPLQLILREIIINENMQATLDAIGSADAAETYLARELVKYCTIVIATLPILAIYPFIQKYFVKGVMIGSLKG